jgi:hypothetical protein
MFIIKQSFQFYLFYVRFEKENRVCYILALKDQIGLAMPSLLKVLILYSFLASQDRLDRRYSEKDMGKVLLILEQERFMRVNVSLFYAIIFQNPHFS